MPAAPHLSYQDLVTVLGDEAESLLAHRCEKVPKESLHLPSHNFVDHIFGDSDRSDAVITNLKRMFDHGRLAHTGYLSILPVDQGIEHTAGPMWVKNPMYFDPENIIRLAIEGGCSAVTSSVGVLGMMARKYSDTIPFMVKLNHNELFSYPNNHDQIMFAQVEQAAAMGAAAVGATVYFGSPTSSRQIVEVSAAFAKAHELGMATVLWCYVRNEAFTVDGVNHERSADMTGQANHLGASIQADIVKQKLPEGNGGILALNKNGEKYADLEPKIYTDLMTDHPIDLTRYQVLNGYAGRVGLITSGGASTPDDWREVVRVAVINKRAGGTGLIAGRKAFQRPFHEGVQMLQAIQDVYLLNEVTIA